MKKFLIIWVIMTFSSFLMYSTQNGDEQKMRINMIRFSDVIVEGEVINIAEETGFYNDTNEVVTILIKEKVVGEAVQSTILLKYPKNIEFDTYWHKPKFKIGDHLIAFLERDKEKSYYPIGGAFGVFKIMAGKVEKSFITVKYFKEQLKNVRNNYLDSVEF
ncbi:MAG: hypothetical protein AB1521_13050 [Bacteroidota bacterium]